MKRDHDLLTPNVKAAFRVAAKAGFLSKRIWHEKLASDRHRSRRFHHWMALMKEGYFSKCFGFIEDALILSPKGVKTAIDLGLDPVNPPDARNLQHDEDVISMAVALEQRGLITQWITESELKAGRMKELFRYQDENRKMKYPDLIAKLKHPSDTVLWAIELERTRKEDTRYCDMVQSYSGTSRINAVLIIAAVASIERNVRRAMDRLSYPQTKRPMVFTNYAEFLANPGDAELRMGEKRSTIATAVARWAIQTPTIHGKISESGRDSRQDNVSGALGQKYSSNSDPRNEKHR